MKTVKLEGGGFDVSKIAYGTILNLVIDHDEGGWVLSMDEDGGDGGWTAVGVTANVFNAHAKSIDENDIDSYEDFFTLWNDSDETYAARKQIIGELHDIYTAQYLQPLKLDSIDATVRGAYLSCAINCGVVGAHVIMGHAIMYRNTSLQSKLSLLDAFCYAWHNHYSAIIAVHPEKHIYVTDWFNRVEFWRMKGKSYGLSQINS